MSDQAPATTEKYIDLAARIFNTTGGGEKWKKRLATTQAVLRWLDEHPEALPKPTITESAFVAEADCAGLKHEEAELRHFLKHLGTTVVPEPEPTNAEKLADVLRRYDLDLITHEGVKELARSLDADGVKAPEATDE